MNWSFFLSLCFLCRLYRSDELHSSAPIAKSEYWTANPIHLQVNVIPALLSSFPFERALTIGHAPIFRSRGGIWTRDFWVMSPTSYRTALPWHLNGITSNDPACTVHDYVAVEGFEPPSTIQSFTRVAPVSLNQALSGLTLNDPTGCCRVSRVPRAFWKLTKPLIQINFLRITSLQTAPLHGTPVV